MLIKSKKFFYVPLSFLILLLPLTCLAEHASPVTSGLKYTDRYIQWRNPPLNNPIYVNLDNDQFLVDTWNRGVQLWDATKILYYSFSDPKVATSITYAPPGNLVGRERNWARIGTPNSGTLFVDYRNDTLLWWDGRRRLITAGIHLEKNDEHPHLLSLNKQHSLLCFMHSKKSRLVRLQQSGDKALLTWESINAPEALATLNAAGITGAVAGGLTEDIVFHACEWAIKNSPDSNIEPLSNGGVVEFMRDKGARVGIVSPEHDASAFSKLLFTHSGYDADIPLRNDMLMLIGDTDTLISSEIISGITRQTIQVPALLIPQVAPYGLELEDGSILMFAGLPPGCSPPYYRHPQHQSRCALPQPSFRYFPKDNRWQAEPSISTPYTIGYWWQTGNSYLVSQWARNDALVRKNGDVAWIEGGEAIDSEKEETPQVSVLKHWKPDVKNPNEKQAAPLRKARTQSTLIELDNGRLVVMGGYAQLERVALEKECFDCPDEFVSIGPFQAARSTEVLDESNAANPVWQGGPVAHYGGGRALKLSNGRVFKLSLIGDSDQQGYRAEISDAAFSNWEIAPSFPLAPALIRNVSVVGNRVIILTDKIQTIVWDDDSKSWLTWENWPKGVGDTSLWNNPLEPISITSLTDKSRVIVRYKSSFEIVNLPKE